MRTLSAVLLAALLLGGCSGGGDDETASPTSTTTVPNGGMATEEDEAPSSEVPDGPDCRSIWRSGKTLPEDFTTCVLDGRVPELDVTECVDGSKLIVADNIMWGRTGEGTIKRAKESPLQDSDAYGTDWALCTGK